MDYTYLWALGCFAGIVIFGFGITKKSLGPLTAPWALGIGAILAISGFALGLGPVLGWDITGEEADPILTIQETPIASPAFDITPLNGSYDPGTGVTHAICEQTVNDDDTGCTVQFRVDLSLDTFRGNYSSFNFTIRPVPPVGADSQDLATIYFSVNELEKYNGEELFYESSNVRQAIWSIDDSETTANYEGSHVMLMTDEDWVELRCIWDGKGSNTFGEEFDSVGDSTTFDIHFWNADRTWTWDYTVTLLCIATAA